MDSSNDNNPVGAPPKPLMDVQPPNMSPVPSAETVSTGVSSAPAPTVMPGVDSTISPDSPTSGLVSPTGSVAPEPDSNVLAGDTNTGAPTVHNPLADATSPDQQQPPKKKSKSMVVILAMVIALGLAGAAYYAYTLTQHEDDNHEASTSTTEAVTPAKASDVGDTSTEIDAAIASVNDDTDFASSDLTDTTLEL